MQRRSLSKQAVPATDEEITKAKNKFRAWNRENAELNELVFNDIDVMITGMMAQARKDKAHEAFMYLTMLQECINTTHPKLLHQSLLAITPTPTNG